MDDCRKDRSWGAYVAWCLLQDLALNEAIAVVISLLLLGTPGISWRVSLAITTVFSQCVGLLCMGAVLATERTLLRLPDRGRLLVVQAILIACGGGGMELGRMILYQLGIDVGPGRLLRALIGAIIAMLVGTSRITITALRSTLTDTERRLHERELTEAQLIRSKTEAELAALRSRIDPHFLFNTLNSIAALVREDPVRAEAATLQLASLFRYALQAHRQTLVALADEIEIVQRYLEIEQLRLGDRLAYEISVDPGLARHQVPALILQPLVENAVRHGIAPSLEGGVVRVRGWREGDRACLSVADSGRGGGQAGGSGEGLDNVRRRLHALYGGRAEVTLRRSAGWTETLVVTPMEGVADAVAADGDRGR